MKIKHITTNTILALAFASSILAQDKVDPYVAAPTGAKAKQESKEDLLDSTFNIVVEVISLPMKEAAELVRSGKTDDQIYKNLLENGKQQELVMMSCGSGQGRATSQSVKEMIYPTEYEPAEIPGYVDVHINSAKFDQAKEGKEADKLNIAQEENISQPLKLKALHQLTSPASPSAFERRNVGFIVDAEISNYIRHYEGEKFVYLRFDTRFVSYLGDSIAGQGLSETKMPRFGLQSLHTSAPMIVGKPRLLGTLNRSPLSKAVGDSGSRVWFSFVTVKSVKSK